MGREKKAERETAYQLYMAGLEPADVAEKASVHYRTLLDWIKKGEWEQKRDELKLAPEQIGRRIRQLLVNKIDSLENSDKGVTPADWDSIIKGSRAVQLVANEASLASKVQTTMQLLRFVQVNLPDDAEVVKKATDLFVKSLANDMKGGGLV